MINVMIFLSFVSSVFVFFSLNDSILLISLVLLLSIFIRNQHLAITLIQLEIFSLMALMVILLKMSALGFSFTLFYLVMVAVVSEATVGLSLLVKLTRNFSQELIKFSL